MLAKFLQTIGGDRMVGPLGKVVSPFRPISLRPGLHLPSLTGVKLNNNRTQHSRPEIFWQCNQGSELELH